MNITPRIRILLTSFLLFAVSATSNASDRLRTFEVPGYLSPQNICQTKVIQSKEQLDKIFRKAFSTSDKRNLHHQANIMAEASKVDFSFEALFLHYQFESTISTRVKLITPTITGTTLSIGIEREETAISKDTIAGYCFGVVFPAAAVEEIELQIESTRTVPLPKEMW